MRNRPLGTPWSAMASSTSAMSARMRRAPRRNASPSAVKVSDRVVRNSSRVPRRCSVRAMIRLTAEGVSPNVRAAADRLPSCATLTNTPISPDLPLKSICAPYAKVIAKNAIYRLKRLNRSIGGIDKEPSMRINPPLVALAMGAFGIGVTEFAPMGMLPGIAADLGVSIPAAGLLVSAYALGVLLGAPLMTLTTGRIPRRYLLIGLMAIFTLGNLMSALATDYYSLMVARVVTSLNHGAFFGVGAASVVAPQKRAGAVAAMFMGLTLATIGGVPLAAWFGELFGWRTAFWGITGLGVVAMAALWFALPNLPAPQSGGGLAENRGLGRGPGLGALALPLVR